MTDDRARAAPADPRTARERHEDEVARQMRENLKKRKAKQRVLRDRADETG